ncbi:hypothetical protein [Streptomyces sp. NBC_01244]|uniref:hypothetical protein n=1 Tax=Streptomyces sp. NBC_01244 TaxID=2903797 RepID=UPI002E143451|nr:hypothetical protein OG247_41060 [Streptomyces sp. NBC_01244]
MPSFRSASIEDGMFSRTDTCHMHVDAGGFAAAAALAEMMDVKHGLACKAVPVVALTSGPQRDDSPDAYAEHHPAHDEDPDADSFASAYLGDTSTLGKARSVLESIYATHPTAVVELEQVVFDVNWAGEVSAVEEEAPAARIELAGARQITPHVPYEYHHGFNLDRSGPLPDLAELTRQLADSGVPFGSIYVFDRGDQVAYRTNCFLATADHDQLLKERQTTIDVVSHLIGQDVLVKTVLERVVGIWQPKK